tara:strand:- start:442 stop:720 length:279 start_codon:yes stop_codon:yes gene_type:complete
MQNLPLEIVNNILIIQYEEQINELKKKLRIINFNFDIMEEKYQNMDNYLTRHEVKYCDKCNIYGDDDEIILYEELEGKYLCEYCEEFIQSIS